VVAFVNDPQARARARDEADNHLDAHFDLATVVKQHEDVYGELTGACGEH